MSEPGFMETSFRRYRKGLDWARIHGTSPLRRTTLLVNLLWLRLLSGRKTAAELPLYLDVGAAGGIQLKWRWAAKLGLVRLSGFEPDAAACDELNRAFPETRFLPFALGDSDGVRTLHITADPQCSSCLEPDPDAVGKYPVGRNFKVVSTLDVPVRSFASLVEAKSISPPDFLKMDVQGFEFEVLRGFGSCLREVIAMELESHTKPLYRGQKTIQDLIRLLDEHGFWLRRFEQQGSFEGECLEANLFFSKPPSSLVGADSRKLTLWEVLSHVPDASFYHFAG